MSQRKSGASAGRYEVFIIGPSGKRFRSRNELKSFFEKTGENTLNPDDFDFSTFGRNNPIQQKVKLPFCKQVGSYIPHILRNCCIPSKPHMSKANITLLRQYRVQIISRLDYNTSVLIFTMIRDITCCDVTSQPEPKSGSGLITYIFTEFVCE